VSRRDVTKIAATLEQALSEHEIDQLGKATGQSQRLRALLAALSEPPMLRATLAQILDFLDHNARRADINRDRRRGRLSVGLHLCGTA